MNYAAPITGGVILLSGIWYFVGGWRHYKGPTSGTPVLARDEVEDEKEA